MSSRADTPLQTQARLSVGDRDGSDDDDDDLAELQADLADAISCMKDVGYDTKKASETAEEIADLRKKIGLFVVSPCEASRTDQ